MRELEAWMIHHRLQLNDNKTEIFAIRAPSSANKHSLTVVVVVVVVVVVFITK